jgi:2-haloacid dehalogenase
VAVFDLGGVLIDWNPRHLYRKLFNGNDATMEHFLATVCASEWNERQDTGRTFDEATRELLPRHADKAGLIEAFGKRFDEMILGAIDGTVDVLAEVKQGGAPVYAITNWSAEMFPPQRRRFAFLSWFDGIVVSGMEGVIKPDRRIFRILFERHGVAMEMAAAIAMRVVQQQRVMGFSRRGQGTSERAPRGRDGGVPKSAAAVSRRIRRAGSRRGE